MSERRRCTVVVAMGEPLPVTTTLTTTSARSKTTLFNGLFYTRTQQQQDTSIVYHFNNKYTLVLRCV